MIRILWVYFNAFLYVLFHIIPIRRRYRHPEKYSIEERFKHTGRLCRVIVKSSRLKVIVEGKEYINDDPVLYVMNHPSMIDPYFVSYAIDKQLGAVIAGDLWFDRIPILAPWFKSIGCIFVDRKNPREGIKGINQGIENMKKGHSLVLFPEGEITSFYSKESVGPFQTGGIKIAVKAKRAIVPIALIGTHEVYSAHEVIGTLKKGTVIVKILEPYTKHLYEHVNIQELTDEIYKRIKFEVDHTEIPS